MERTRVSRTATAAARLCAWPVPAVLLALTYTAGPAQALLEGGSSAALPAIETVAAAPEPELWLSPTARARDDWRRTVCTGTDHPAGDLRYGDHVRSAYGTLMPSAVTPVLLSQTPAEPVRPTRRPSYILAAHLIPRDPATVRPVKRPVPETMLADRLHLWQGPAVRTAAFAGDALSDDAYGVALWRAYLCSDSDGATSVASGGFGPGAIIPPTAVSPQPEQIARPAGRDRGRAITPVLLGGIGGGGGGGGSPDDQAFLVVPAVGAPGGPPPGDPAFRSPGGPGGGGGPGALPWAPTPDTPGGPPIDPRGPPLAADPSPVPLPAPLLLLLTACAALVFGRRITSFWRAS